MNIMSVQVYSLLRLCRLNGPQSSKIMSISGFVGARLGVGISGQKQQFRFESGTGLSSKAKIDVLGDQISQLTLLETADLVLLLKAKLNLPDIPIGGFAFAGPETDAKVAATEEEEKVAPTQEKTMFTLKLQSFEAGSKPKVIKEIKNLLGLNLVESKKFVESAPKTIKESVPKEDAEKIVDALKAVGATVTME